VRLNNSFATNCESRQTNSDAGKEDGSVRIVTPKKFMSTVECPIQVKVNCVSLHFEGSGLAKADAIGRQLSMVHSRQRSAIQRRGSGAGCFLIVHLAIHSTHIGKSARSYYGEDHKEH
jgi:hypothetical protein